MKKTIKLLLLAVLASSAWGSIAAQGKLRSDLKLLPSQAETNQAVKPVGVSGVDVTTVNADSQNASTGGENTLLRKAAPSRPKNLPSPQLGELTVAEGEATNQYAPIFGYFCDNYYSSSSNRQTRTQMIYPASMLAGMAGKYIDGVTFYTDANGIQFSSAAGNVTLTIKLGACYNNYSSFNGSERSFTGTTVSKTVVPKKGDKTISVVFDNEFQYTAGTNLLIEVRVTTAGTADAQNGDTKFVGTETTASQSLLYYYGRSGNVNENVNFLPKVTFGIYEKLGDYTIDKETINFAQTQCGASKTENVVVTNHTNNSANISWSFAGLNADKFSTSSTATTVAANSSVTIPITFTPGSKTGSMSGSMKIMVDNTLLQVMLHGSAKAGVGASVTPNPVDLGEVLFDQTSTATVTLTNTGMTSITPTFTQPGVTAFSVVGGYGALASGESRKYTVVFSPIAGEVEPEDKEYESSFKITDAAAGFEQVVTLKGKGVTVAPVYVVKQETESNVTTSLPLTFCSGESTNGSVPVWGYYADYGCKGQMLYTTDRLNGLQAGDVIKSITFFANSNLTASHTGDASTVTLQMAEVGDNSLTDFITVPAGSVVATQSNLWTGTQTITFTFDTPYTYNGGNLLFDVAMNYKSSGAWGTTTWLGTELGGNDYYSYYSRNNEDGAATEAAGSTFLPKMTLDVDRTSTSGGVYVRAELVDWGEHNTGAFYNQDVTLYNPNSNDVTVELSATKPFYFANNTGSVSKSATVPSGHSTQTIWFNPTDAASYTGYLTIDTDGHTSKTRLTGIGLGATGTIATRDSSFFAGITYDWTDSEGKQHTSNLAEVATDPDQIIALVKKVYTDTNIPGNLKRGYTSSGANESGYPVTYPAVGTLKHTGNNYNNVGNYSYDDTYGWGIETQKPLIHDTERVRDYSSYYSTATTTAHYVFMDSMEFKPKYEGVTLLLAEMIDDFNHYTTFYDFDNDGDGYLDNVVYDSDPAKNLRAYIANTIKSMRVVTDSKRTGTGQGEGTLFKLDCDKMNKFYLLAKGRLRWVNNAYEAETGWSNYSGDAYPLRGQSCATPSYIYCANNGVDGYFDGYSRQPFRYMFEQFSPVVTESSTGLADIYQELVDMKSFGVVHDCANVGDMNHQFMMYGDDSEAADCQDVRDMMFFVPDYRMLKDADRDPSFYEKFLYYNAGKQPKMGLFVIHQDEVQGSQETGKDVYNLTLTWNSNLDEFLPNDMQEYQLWEVVTDEFGVSKYQPVYKTNSDGLYVDSNGQPLADQTAVATQGVPVVLDRAALADPSARQTYTNLYVKMTPGSQTKTYAIRGQDKEHFLSLQMSNEQDYIIPGLDATEIMTLSSATYFSRFNPQTENNCYSNKIQIKANPHSVRESYIGDANNQTVMTVTRTSRVLNGNDTITTTAPVAKIYMKRGDRNISVVMDNQAEESEFPAGRSDAEGTRRAGYHANPITANNNMVFGYSVDGGYVDFDFAIWDNFIADVSKNQHPGLYTYQVTFTSASTIDNATGDNTHGAHSNEFRVPVYKTDSRISEAYTLDQVLNDSIHTLPSPGDVEFEAQVQLSSKTEILRYDAYRWKDNEPRFIVENAGELDEDERDIEPNGLAGNQGDKYSVSMNRVGTDDYYTGTVTVSTASPRNWAKFVDYMPTNVEDPGSYTYAPVVELFTKGYNQSGDKRTDYNTYGGPMKNTAVGKLNVSVDMEFNESTYPLMSNYTWTGDGHNTGEYGQRYSYYYIRLKFDALDVPPGYELYKVRAWRQVDPSLLAEQRPSRRERVVGDYMFEDINYGDKLDKSLPITMDKEYLKSVPLGSRSNEIAKPNGENMFDYDGEYDLNGETRAMFGAKRLSTYAQDTIGTIDRIEAKFKVRAYFTKQENPLIASQANHGPRKAEVGSDFDYYIAEGEAEFDSNNIIGPIITGIGTVAADVNREVVGVTYVNALGQQSSRPFEGVNMVVTRYSDGSSTTTKVVK